MFRESQTTGKECGGPSEDQFLSVLIGIGFVSFEEQFGEPKNGPFYVVDGSPRNSTANGIM
jgi:hypothetical protein